MDSKATAVDATVAAEDVLADRQADAALDSVALARSLVCSAAAEDAERRTTTTGLVIHHRAIHVMDAATGTAAAEPAAMEVAVEVAVAAEAVPVAAVFQAAAVVRQHQAVVQQEFHTSQRVVARRDRAAVLRLQVADLLAAAVADTNEQLFKCLDGRSMRLGRALVDCLENYDAAFCHHAERATHLALQVTATHVRVPILPADAV